MEVEEEGGEVAATCISVHSLAGAACGDMADEKHTEIKRTEVCDWRERSSSFSLSNDSRFKKSEKFLVRKGH